MTTIGSVTLVEAAIADPAAAFGELRRRGAVAWDEDTVSWYVLSAELVRPLLRDSRLRARGVPEAVRELPPDERAVVGPVEEFLGRWLVFSDPPKQALLRRALAPELTRVRYAELADRLPAEARERVAAVAGRPGDLLDDVVRPLSQFTVRELLGLTAAQLTEVVEVSAPLMTYLGLPGMNVPAAALAGTAIDRLVELTRELTEAGTEGTAATLCRLRTEDTGVDDLDVAAAYAQLITGALEPLTTAVAECVVAAAQPGVVIDPIEDFTEAVLRARPPFHFAPRIARTDIEIGGRLVRAGQRVVLNLLAAGLDGCPVTGGKEAREHFSFGAGTHYCLGAPVSRAHLAAVVPVLVAAGLPGRLDLARLARRPSFGMSSFERVPLTAG